MVRVVFLFLVLILTGCSMPVVNDPYPAGEWQSNTLYLGFVERPKHLDPAQAYSSDAYAVIGQILEPPLQYHYLKRPYTLIPLTLSAMPKVTLIDTKGRTLPADAPAASVYRSIYELHVRPGIYYQPHPALARDAAGRSCYIPLSAHQLAHMRGWRDFTQLGTRELVAADYAHEIRRLASPQVNSPILGLMEDYIVGFRAYAQMLDRVAGRWSQDRYLDLERYPLPGVQVVDRYTLRIELQGKYPQFLYWLAMPFFAPVPPEVDAFTHQPGMAAHNFTLEWHPLGTGPYLLSFMQPNWRMELSRNPNFHGERYPDSGDPGDAQAGLLRYAGQSLPFADHVVFTLEKEVIPYWDKFMQGYYDLSLISSDTFDQAIRLDAQGEPRVSPELARRGMQLDTAVMTSIYYVAFNMLDNVVGGYSDRARKLRQALSIAVNYEDFISIFLNGRGIAAQGPIPPGIFGYEDGEAGINPVVYHSVNGRIERRSLDDARRLLAEAGYPGGRDARTGAPLVLYYDNTFTGPDAKAYVDWMASQLARLGIQMVSRSSDFNRFQDKLRRGNTQMFVGGWNADYPDPENFLFLFYGPNAKVGSNGENDANYHNARYDALFDQMKYMPDGPERLRVIQQMISILRYDAPWMFGYFPRQYMLRQGWVGPGKANVIANNTLKYVHVDPALRARQRQAWNHPVRWPLFVLGGLVLTVLVSARFASGIRDRMTAR